MQRLLRFSVSVVLMLYAGCAFAACHVVTPSGSGAETGADWNNAYAGLPSTLIRGDIYYLADGTYPAYTFNTPLSGTLTVEIRKAQPSDNCTATGWNSATMGSSQANFSSTFVPVFSVQSGYLVLNGNGSSTAQGCGGAPGTSYSAAPPNPPDCGIKITNACTSSNSDACDNPISVTNSNNVVMEYLEELASGDNNASRNELYLTGGDNNFTLNHAYMHNSGCVYIQQYNGNGRTIEFSYFWGTEVNGVGSNPCHGQAVFDSPPNSNESDHDNVYRDITGTSVWTYAQPIEGTATNNVFYNDIIWNSTSFTPSGGLTLGTTTNGVLACINSGINCTNFVFVQNTIVNKGFNSGVEVSASATGSGWLVENNLWYQDFSTGPTPGGVVLLLPSGSTENYNSILNSGGGGSGSNDVNASSAPDPFVNWQSGNFALASDNASWSNRVALSSAYNTDAAGNAFTTDRGVYQYNGSTATVQPPTALTATVSTVN